MGSETANDDKTLDDWRRQIDALDADLLRLLNQRAAIACEIASIKVASALPAYDGNRERQVLARVLEKNTGPLDNQSVTDIFAGIIRETRRLGTQRMQEQQRGEAAARVRS
ncbi:MAG TPA: chorismate mutase [Candidatus Angelobacter sp.]